MNAEAGVYFAVDGERVRIKATRRADLQIGRLDLHAKRVADLQVLAAKQGESKRSILPTVMGVIVTPSYDSAQKLQRAIERTWVTKRRQSEGEGLWYALTHSEVTATLKQCANTFKLKCQGISLQPRKSGAKHPAGPMSVTRYVPDPSIAKSEKIIQMATLDQKRRAAQVQVEVKMSTLIGGLSRLGKVRDEHKQAAARLKTLHEQAQLGGARAVDYAAVKVDTSGSGENNIGEIGEQARRDYKIATDALGSAKTEIVERIVIFGETVSQIAKGRGIGNGGAARAKVTTEVVDAVDDLAHHFGLYAGAGRGKVRVTRWADGPRLPMEPAEREPVTTGD